MGRNGRSNKFIWVLAVMLALLVLSAAGLKSAFPAALALEQEARCGLEEHVHTEECYVDRILVCREKMHTHSPNCYLVLLEDNDINELLTRVDAAEDKSLESLISATVLRAASYVKLSAETGADGSAVPESPGPTVSPGVTPSLSPSPTLSLNFSADASAGPTVSPSQTLMENEPLSGAQAAQPITNEQIAALNAAVDTSESGVVLNENLVTPGLSQNAGERELLDTLLNTGTAPGGVSTLAVGQNPVTGTRAINFYIMLDGEIVCINNGTLSDGKPDYYSYSNTAAAYGTEGVITALTANNIGSTYFLRYNTNGSTSQFSSFNTDATYQGSQVRMGNNNNTRYAILTTRSRSQWNGYTYSPVEFWTVTLDYTAIADGPDSDVQYVQNGLDSTLKLSDEYLWYLDAAGETPASEEALENITQRTTLYARWPSASCTVTYRDRTGSVLHTVEVMYGTTLNELPDTPEENQVWVDEDGAPVDLPLTVTGDLTLTAVPGAVATYLFADGRRTEDGPYPIGYELILPETSDGNYVWADENGTYYPGGSTVSLTRDMTFTESAALTIVYNLNFPDSGLPDSDSTPTLAENGLTTDTVIVPAGSSAAIYSVTPRTYISAMDGEAAHFEGWIPAGDTSVRIEPGTNLTWEVLNRYAVDGTVTLNGDWSRDDTNSITDVRFYVRFDSIAPDFSGSVGSYETNYYTSQIYHAYAGNAPAHNSGFTIADVTPDNSYTADQTIRALVGDKGDGELWISGVPDDAWLFEQLKEFTYENATDAERRNNQYLRIYAGTDANGNAVYETVLADELDTDHYSLRWYVFKKEGDGWHVDGRLVKKDGVFKVDKVFGGIGDAVEQARDGFYILAENGTVTNGVFTPYAASDSNYNAHILALDQAAANTLASRYPNATVQVYGTALNTEGEAVDAWQVNGGKLGEIWRFTEMAVLPTYTDPITGDEKNYSWYAEYTVSDSDGSYSQIARFGSEAIIPVKTYALDKDPDQGLSLDFTNYYYDNESILVRKIDGDTGLPLGGAEFQLWQDGVQLKFRDSGTGIYSVDPNGDIGSITTNSEGFSVITVDSFSYENGELVVREVTAPDGYAVINDVTIHYLNGTDGDVGITDIAGVTDPADYDYHAGYYNENGGILVVKDHAAYYTSVTVNKVWADAVTEDEVTVVLQANGSRATNIFPNLTNAEVVLNAANGWTHTWDQLPAYANGEQVSWSVKEVKIGTDTTMLGSDTFANWIVVYSTPVQTDADGDGIVDNWAVTVTNTVRRTMINGIKTSDDGSLALAGALFTLTEVEWNPDLNQWEDKAGMPTLTAESGSDGRLLFDGLTAGAFYRLTETRAPNGYMVLSEPVYLTVDGMGVMCGAADGVADTTTLNTGMVTYTGPYVITIKNIKPNPLPETGGCGTIGYYAAGMALMLLALSVAILPKLWKRGRYRMRD